MISLVLFNTAELQYVNGTDLFFPLLDEHQADELGNYQQHQEMCYPHLVRLKMHRSRTPSDTLMAAPLLIWSESFYIFSNSSSSSSFFFPVLVFVFGCCGVLVLFYFYDVPGNYNGLSRYIYDSGEESGAL